jgi:YHS domain-containing protein
MPRLCRSLTIALVTALLTACATTPTPPISAGPHAECLVCKHNADLACVDIPVTAGTPRTTIDGKTYYFCSDECKAKFEKAPARYVTAAR